MQSFIAHQRTPRFLVVTLLTLISTATALSSSNAQQSANETLGVVGPVSVRAIESVNEFYPTAVHIVVVTDDGSARSLAAQVRTLEFEPQGAP